MTRSKFKKKIVFRFLAILGYLASSLPPPQTLPGRPIALPGHSVADRSATPPVRDPDRVREPPPPRQAPGLHESRSRPRRHVGSTGKLGRTDGYTAKLTHLCLDAPGHATGTPPLRSPSGLALGQFAAGSRRPRVAFFQQIRTCLFPVIAFHAENFNSLTFALDSVTRPSWKPITSVLPVEPKPHFYCRVQPTPRARNHLRNLIHYG